MALRLLMIMQHMHVENVVKKIFLRFILASEGNLPNPHYQGC